jgi:hypothetical protein
MCSIYGAVLQFFANYETLKFHQLFHDLRKVEV